MCIRDRMTTKQIKGPIDKTATIRKAAIKWFIFEQLASIRLKPDNPGTAALPKPEPYFSIFIVYRAGFFKFLENITTRKTSMDKAKSIRNPSKVNNSPSSKSWWRLINSNIKSKPSGPKTARLFRSISLCANPSWDLTLWSSLSATLIPPYRYKHNKGGHHLIQQHLNVGISAFNVHFS